MRLRSIARSRAFAGRRGRWGLKWLGRCRSRVVRPGMDRLRDLSPQRAKTIVTITTALRNNDERWETRETMKKSGKNVEKARKAVEARPYTLQEAVPLLQKVKFAKFDETVEVTHAFGSRSQACRPDGARDGRSAARTGQVEEGPGDRQRRQGSRGAKRPARISSAAKTWSRRSPRKTGPTSTR